MKILFLLIFLGAIAVAAYAYWTLLQLTLAAWGSRWANPKWVAFMQSYPGLLPMRLFKWLLPSAGIVFIIVLLIQIVQSKLAI